MTTRSRRAIVASALAAAMLGWPGAASTAHAQEGWTDSKSSISAITAVGGAIAAPRIAVDAAGNALAVWTEPGATGARVVKGARYTAASRLWGAPLSVSGVSPRGANTVRLAVDAVGNGLAIWDEGSVSVSSTVHTARYDAATGVWAAPELRSAGVAAGAAAVALTPSGDALAVWTEFIGLPQTGVFASRFTAVSGTWTAAERITADTSSALTLAADAAGNGVVVWQAAVGQPIRSARFLAATGMWSAPGDLSAAVPGPGLAVAFVATNAAGDAVAVWSRSGVVEAARAPAGLAFGAPSTVSLIDGLNEAARVAIDPLGNAVVAWTRSVATERITQVSRYDALAAAWSAPTDLGEPGFAYSPAAVAVDPAGNALVLWSRSLASPGIRVLAARYVAATGTWTTTANLSTIQRGAFNVDVAFDAGGTAAAVWFESEQGFGVIQSRSWLATPAAPSLTEVTPTSGHLAVTVAAPPAVEAAFAATTLEYSLDGGATWTPRTPSGVGSPLAIPGLTDGVAYDLRVRAVNGAGAGRASTALLVRSGTGTTPTDLRVVSRTGNTTTFAWVAPVAGIVPTGYLIEGGISGQSQILASIPSGGTATQITLSVPNGVFFARVVAVHGATRLGQSSALQFSVNAGVFPSAPANLLGSASGDRLALSWTNTWTGATLTRVRLDVGGTVITAIDLPPAERFTFDGVPPGTYTFAVAPLTGTVPGDYSNVVTLTFPGACTSAPHPPAAFSASAQGGRVFLDWLPPSAGAAATSYVVSVTGAFTGSFPTTSRTLAVPVGPGSYTVSVAAVGLCGTSTATPAQTVVVP